MNRIRNAGGCVQLFMLPLLDDQKVSGKVLSDDEPALPGPFASSADAESPPLTDRIIHETIVRAYPFPCLIDDLAGLRRKEGLQKTLEVALADETYPGRILLFRIDESLFRGHGTYFRFFHIPDREQNAGQLVGAKPCQKVGLVLLRIASLQEQYGTSRTATETGVMTGRNEIGTALDRELQKSLELDLRIAQDVRVRRSAEPVFLQKVGENPLPVFLGKADRVIWDADLVRDSSNVLKIAFCGAYAERVLLIPVFHKNPRDGKPRFFEQEGRYRTVNASGQANDNAFHKKPPTNRFATIVSQFRQNVNRTDPFPFDKTCLKTIIN